MLGNFFSGARKYLSGALSAIASHMPLMRDEQALTPEAIALAARPMRVGERKVGDSGRFWWRAKWVSPAMRHSIANNKALMANENGLLHGLLKRNAYYHG